MDMLLDMGDMADNEDVAGKFEMMDMGEIMKMMVD